MWAFCKLEEAEVERVYDFLHLPACVIRRHQACAVDLSVQFLFNLIDLDQLVDEGGTCVQRQID